MHALGQVASYDGPLPPLRSLNALLPDDVAVLAVDEVPDGFSARHDAVARSYAYRVHLRRAGQSPFERGRSLWWPHRVDFAALRACATALVGERDFTAFTPTDSYHQRFQRVVHAAAWRPAGQELLEFTIEADSFMRNMNRVLVGTMLEVAGGRRTIADFRRLLRGAPRSDAGPTAPALGLYLVSVKY